MKNVVMGAMMSIIIALITIIILTTDDRIVRINEDNTALANALDESISIIDTDKYSISDTSQLIADITEGLLMQIESDSDITINVMDADRDRGIVTIEAVQDFIKPTGKSGQVAATRTIILEEKQPEDTYDEDNKIYNIHFLTPEGDTYMNMGVKNQEKLIIPEAPEGNYWMYNGTKIEPSDNIIVSSDMYISLSE